MNVPMCLVDVVNGRLVAQSPNPAVSYSLFAEIWKWMNEKASLMDVVVRLRPRTVPSGYKYHTWKAGTLTYMYMYKQAQVFSPAYLRDIGPILYLQY